MYIKELCEKLELPKNGENTNELLALYTHYLNNKNEKIYSNQDISIPSSFDESIIKDRYRYDGTPKFTFIDLFSGIGGFRIALQKLGGKCVFSSEWDSAAQETYFSNFGEVPFGDITKESTKAMIPQKFDILCAGFPCQPFSYAGQKKGFNDPTKGTLFFDVCEILRQHKPRAFFLENVKGIVSHDSGNTIRIIREKLKDELGYTIYEGVLNSLDFGLPQKRERWYCVGFKDATPFEFPKGKKEIVTLRSIIDMNDKDPSLRLPKFELDRIKYHFAHADEIRVKHDNSKYEPNTKKGKYGIYSFQKPDGSLRFHVGDVAKTQIQEAFYSCLDTYASTIIANRTPKLWDIERKLSILESKRLQGFPDDYIVPVSNAQGYKQLGNSVSIPVLEEIGIELIKGLGLKE